MKTPVGVVVAALALTSGASWLLSGMAIGAEEPAKLIDPSLWEDQHAAPPVVLGSGAIDEDIGVAGTDLATEATGGLSTDAGETPDLTWTLTQTTYADPETDLTGTCYSIEIGDGAVESCTPGELEPDASEPILVSVGDSQRIELTLAKPSDPLVDAPDAVGATLVHGEELRWEIRQEAG